MSKKIENSLRSLRQKCSAADPGPDERAGVRLRAYLGTGIGSEQEAGVGEVAGR